MTRTLALSLTLAMGMVSSLATAAPRATYKWVDESLIGSEYVAPPKAAVSNVIYLNNCKPNGCQIKSGWDNATTNTSSVPDASTTISAYTGSDASWDQIVACVKQTYADFDVQIVTERPASGNYHMAIVAGQPAQAGMQSGVLGVSPFSCGYIPNAISYTFANVAPNNVAELCWTVAQETAHSWGLDHKYDNRDPMTYLSGGPTYKRFQDDAGSCGEYNARSCQCNYSSTPGKMNSYQLVMQTFGPNTPDTIAPTVAITYPTENAQVTPGFPVRADVSDDRVVAKVEFRLDGQLIKTVEDGPYNFSSPASLSQGRHTVELTAYDRANNVKKSTVTVQYGTVCAQDSECGDPSLLCMNGRCITGPGSTGGLGSTCDDNGQCSSGQCASDGTNGYCVESCDPAASACPGGFSCLAVGAGGVCWPAEGDGGGCSTGDDGHGGSLVMLLGLVGLVLARKRR